MFKSFFNDHRHKAGRRIFPPASLAAVARAQLISRSRSKLGLFGSMIEGSPEREKPAHWRAFVYLDAIISSGNFVDNDDAGKNAVIADDLARNAEGAGLIAG